MKAEWLNPTGSFKDRIALHTIRDAVQSGTRGWVGTSSGNGGAAMSAYGARAGLPGFLCIAADAPKRKLQSIIPYGATLLPMSQLGLREMDEIGALAVEYHLKLAVTAYRYNPEGLVGAEAIGDELVDQGPFTHVYVPTGGGGLARGNRTRSGPRIPRRASSNLCTPRGCAPIAPCLEGELNEPLIDECASSISGLQLAAPPDGALAPPRRERAVAGDATSPMRMLGTPRHCRLGMKASLWSRHRHSPSRRSCTTSVPVVSPRGSPDRSAHWCWSEGSPPILTDG